MPSQNTPNHTFTTLHALAAKGRIFQNILGSDRAIFVTESALDDLKSLGIKPTPIPPATKLLYDRDPRFDLTKSRDMISFKQISEAIEAASPNNPENLQMAATVFNASYPPPAKDSLIDAMVSHGHQPPRAR